MMVMNIVPWAVTTPLNSDVVGMGTGVTRAPTTVLNARRPAPAATPWGTGHGSMFGSK